jgi:hypothetical protein
MTGARIWFKCPGVTLHTPDAKTAYVLTFAPTTRRAFPHTFITFKGPPLLGGLRGKSLRAFFAAVAIRNTQWSSPSLPASQPAVPRRGAAAPRLCRDSAAWDRHAGAVDTRSWTRIR